MTTKKRITKHQMKQDHFVDTVFRFREWAESNLNSIFIIIGAVIAVIVLAWFLASTSNKKEIEAFDLLGRAEVEVRTNQPQLAIIDFQKVVDDFGSTDAAKLAAFKLANLYFDQNDFVKAETAFEKYLGSFADDEISRISAMEGLAASYAGQGRAQEAGNKYLEIAQIDKDGINFERNLFTAIENFVQANDTENARSAFALLSNAGITSEYFRNAKILLIEKGILDYDQGEFK